MSVAALSLKETLPVDEFLFGQEAHVNAVVFLESLIKALESQTKLTDDQEEELLEQFSNLLSVVNAEHWFEFQNKFFLWFMFATEAMQVQDDSFRQEVQQLLVEISQPQTTPQTSVEQSQ